jgi:hypothetical protein
MQYFSERGSILSERSSIKSRARSRLCEMADDTNSNPRDYRAAERTLLA